MAMEDMMEEKSFLCISVTSLNLVILLLIGSLMTDCSLKP